MLTLARQAWINKGFSSISSLRGTWNVPCWGRWGWRIPFPSVCILWSHLALVMSFLSFIYPCQSQLLSVQTGWDDAQRKAAAGPAHSQRFTLRTVQESSDPDVAPVWPLDLLFFVHFTETSLGSTKKIRKYRGQSVFRYWHRHTFDWFNFSFEHTYINIHLRSWKLTLQLIYYSFAPFSGFHVPVAVSGWNVIRLDAADLNRTWDFIDLKKHYASLWLRILPSVAFMPPWLFV